MDAYVKSELTSLVSNVGNTLELLVKVVISDEVPDDTHLDDIACMMEENYNALQKLREFI